jgi:hypothetical protein
MNSSRSLNFGFPRFQTLWLCCCLLLLGGWQRAAARTDWPYVGGDAGGMRYSTLDQINRKNVTDLQVAWTEPLNRFSIAESAFRKVEKRGCRTRRQSRISDAGIYLHARQMAHRSRVLRQ